MAVERRTDDEKAQEITKRLDQLKQYRQPFESAVDECIEFTAPDLSKISDKDTKGLKKGQTVYDGTAISALNLMADGLHGYLVSPAIRWFSLTLPIKMQNQRWSPNMRKRAGKALDEIDEVKVWVS